MDVADLLPAHRREARQRRLLRRRWMCGAGAFAGAVVLSGLVLASIMPANADLSASELARINDSVARTQRSIAEVEPRLVDTQRTLRANLSVSGQPDWSVLLALLADVAGEDIVLSRCKLEPQAPPVEGAVEPKGSAAAGGAPGRPVPEQTEPKYVLDLSGLARNQTQTSQFVLRLEQMGLFERVRLVNTSTSQIKDTQLSSFQLTCDLKHDGGDVK